MFSLLTAQQTYENSLFAFLWLDGFICKFSKNCQNCKRYQCESYHVKGILILKVYRHNQGRLKPCQCLLGCLRFSSFQGCIFSRNCRKFPFFVGLKNNGAIPGNRHSHTVMLSYFFRHNCQHVSIVFNKY